MELLKQGQYSPYPMEEQVVSVWLGTTGQLDDVAVDDVRKFERELLDHLRRSGRRAHHDPRDRQVRGRHRGQAASPRPTRSRRPSRPTTDGVEAGHEEADAMEGEDVAHEKIVRQKRG